MRHFSTIISQDVIREPCVLEELKTEGHVGTVFVPIDIIFDGVFEVVPVYTS
jgi:hypothetical protein